MRILQSFGMPRMEFDAWLASTCASATEWCRKMGIGNVDEVKRLYPLFFQQAVNEGIIPAMYEEVPAVLSGLRSAGQAIHILSAHPRQFLQREITAYGIADLVDEVVGSVSDKTGTMRTMRAAHTRALAVGDTVYDIRAAKQAVEIDRQ